MRGCGSYSLKMLVYYATAIYNIASKEKVRLGSQSRCCRISRWQAVYPYIICRQWFHIPWWPRCDSIRKSHENQMYKTSHLDIVECTVNESHCWNYAAWCKGVVGRTLGMLLCSALLPVNSALFETWPMKQIKYITSSYMWRKRTKAYRSYRSGR